MFALTDSRSNVRTRRFLAYLFVFSVLTCHGLFGAAHISEAQAAMESMPAAMHESSVQSDHGSHSSHASDDESSGLAHCLSTEYFAVLFASLLASAMLFVRSELPGSKNLLPLLGGLFQRLRPVPGLPLTRGPTRPALQVFRL